MDDLTQILRCLGCFGGYFGGVRYIVTFLDDLPLVDVLTLLDDLPQNGYLRGLYYLNRYFRELFYSDLMMFKMFQRIFRRV